jgi:subtilisin family serine protease
MHSRASGRSRLPFIAAAAAVALVGSVVTVNQAAVGSTPSFGGQSSFARPTLPRNSVSHGLPRAAQRLAGSLPAGVPAHGRSAFLLQLSTGSTFAAYRHNLQHSKALASSAAKTQLSKVRAAQANVISALPSGSSVLYKTHSVLAGVAVVANVRNYAALQRISGVAAVYPISAKSYDNSYAVPLVGAPKVWASHGNDLGQNSTIAIIDTGIDYTHANLGGPGTTAAYDAAKATDTLPPAYPDADKIVGGADFAGDDYNPDPTDPAYQPIPHPDSNPLDCNGHGSHVAGIAAGYGENTNGTTFGGDYTTLGALSMSNYRAMFRIGPGMAPKAHLLAYKVFGCEGSTDVVGNAIDAAADPNGDGDPSDHADVINMSLGSDYGSPQDGDSVLANLASRLGISVVVASGNGGDQYDVGGSPGDAVRTIAVANSVDAYSQIDTLHATVNGNATDFGAQRSEAYDWTTNPDLGGPVVKLSDASNLDGCDTITQDLTGKIAFLNWTDDDASRRCGSATRSANVVAAHGTGAILADDEETFAAGITGSVDIPVVMVVKSAGDAMRTALNASQPVSVTGTTAGDFSQVLDGSNSTPNINDTVNTSSSRGVRGAGDVKPDVTSVGTSVFSTAMGTGDDGVSFTGTSMATPNVAGLSALVRTVRKDWNPEEVKADIMNTAGQELFTGDAHTGTRFAPNRVGAGRIQATKALDNLVLAYVQNDPGAVSVSFGSVAISGATTLTKTVKVDNKSLHTVSYDVGYHSRTTVPGVSYQVSPKTLTIAPASSKTFTVKLVVTNPAALTKTHDATIAMSQGGLPREFLADASGLVVLAPTQGTSIQLRVPVYSAPHPASTMTESSSLTLSGSGTQHGTLTLSGHGVNQGTGSAQVRSYVAGFELQAKSGLAPTCATASAERCVHYGDERAADLKYVGTTSDYPLVKALGDPTPFRDSQAYFSITTQGRWRSPAGFQEFDVLISTNGDNIPDAVVYNTRLGESDIFLSELVDITDPDPNNWFVRDDELINDRFGRKTVAYPFGADTALFDSDTMVLPIAPATLGKFTFPGGGPTLPPLPGFDSTHTRIKYAVQSFGATGIVDSIGASASSGLLTSSALTMDVRRPGIEVTSSSITSSPTIGLLLNNDQPGLKLNVRRDVAAYNTDRGQSALLIHSHNKLGSKAKLVNLKSAPKVTLKLSSTKVALYGTLTATVTVANTAGHVPTGHVDLRRPGSGIYKSGTLSGGKVTLSFRPAETGTYKIRAEYGGDLFYRAGVSATLTFTVT